MAGTAKAKTMYVMTAVGVVAALLSADAAAQDVRQIRPRQQIRLSQQVLVPEMVLLPEVVLLPDPVPLPMQLPVPQAVPLPEPAPILAPAQVLDQVISVAQVQIPDQFPTGQQARPRFETPPSESTAIPEPAPPPAVQLVISSQQAQPQTATFENTDALPPVNPAISMKDHPAVGSWFGKAVQVCAAGVAPAACNGGQPAVALFMTPTLSSDGIFLGNDSFALLPAPFGPHTTAHGAWVATSATEFTAEYVFMGDVFPPVANTVTGYRFRWLAKVISADTAVGYVNLYSLATVPLTWTPLQADEFPAFPVEALGFVTPPAGVVTDPTTCMGTGCPLVFKFTIKRVTR